MTSGEREDYNKLQLKRSVLDLQLLIMTGLSGISHGKLLLNGVKLDPQLSLQDAGLYEGVDINAAVYKDGFSDSDATDDSMPALVDSD